ncbi:Glycosyl hydrolase 53-domain-containing protein [Mycena indigotica]|uniref:Glycosyl hydrolase 53-domain-containing protein n=1 Tax=Mycena indigotica TaxID=2126181 RepID=A0A8H6SHM9_9AGAR|nr:Glycosyl hydrolase 53-domain-containing protein [Mycena indigotica]KAF7298856.1 Glycosyl hydrolase 53-domain-containing protein [Mycena indigotica]
MFFEADVYLTSISSVNYSGRPFVRSNRSRTKCGSGSLFAPNPFAMLVPLSLLSCLAFLLRDVAAAATKSSKRGLAYAADNKADILKANNTASVVSWVYNWALNPPDYLANSGIEYIPMQWGAEGIENLAVTVKGLGAKTILGFNEPDFAEQSNMNATFAAQLWMQYIEPLKADGVRLGGPAVSSGASGRPWLDEFMKACSKCTIDFIPFHWYGEGTGGFTDYLYQLHGQYPNHTLWVTEYAETANNDTLVLNTLNSTITMLDGLDWVERYAWFGYFRPKDGSHYNLLDVNGNLNAAGQVYVDSAKKVVSALPNPTGSGTGVAPINTAGGYTTVYPASDTGLTPAFATPTGSGAIRVVGSLGYFPSFLSLCFAILVGGGALW